MLCTVYQLQSPCQVAWLLPLLCLRTESEEQWLCSAPFPTLCLLTQLQAGTGQEGLLLTHSSEVLY
jgi:hypothetical protein